MNRVMSLLGLARRAGKIAWQSEEIISKIRRGNVHLLIVAGDTGPAVLKKYSDKSSTYGVRVVTLATRAELGSALGLPPKSAVAVLDEGFARSIAEALHSTGS